jgi:hypothetical protein
VKNAREVNNRPGQTRQDRGNAGHWPKLHSARRQGAAGVQGPLPIDEFRTGKGIFLTLWETEEDLKASEESGYYQEQLGKLAEALAGQPEKEDYEVSIQV